MPEMPETTVSSFRAVKNQRMRNWIEWALPKTHKMVVCFYFYFCFNFSCLSILFFLFALLGLNCSLSSVKMTKWSLQILSDHIEIENIGTQYVHILNAGRFNRSCQEFLVLLVLSAKMWDRKINWIVSCNKWRAKSVFKTMKSLHVFLRQSTS